MILDPEEKRRMMKILHERKDIVATESGEYVFWPTNDGSDGRGYLPAHALRWIADELDEMNSDLYT